MLDINFVYLGTKILLFSLRHAEISLFCSSQNAANFIIPSLSGLYNINVYF